MPALMLLSALCMTHPALASTVINGDLSGDHVWTPANSPYVIQDARILPGASVTVEPGVVVKMSPKDASGPFIVQGTLTLGRADAAAQVIVTSLLDDVVGGDTNGDGDATTPNPGDWRNISASAGGVIRMYHTTMLYGGANTGYDYVCKGYCGYTKYADGQLVNDGGSVEVHTVSFSRSIGEHVSQFSGVSVLEGSNFYNAPRGVKSMGGELSIEQSTFSMLNMGFDVGATTLMLSGNQFTRTPGNRLETTGGSYLSDGRNTSDGAVLKVQGDVEREFVFPAEGFTYRMGSTRILPTGTMDFSPGVIVKVDQEMGILVEGSFKIGSATSTQWSLVTSLLDDTQGGDSNGDGANTAPGQGSWNSIRIEQGGTAQLFFTELRYGGAMTGYDYHCSYGSCGYTYYANGQLFNHGGILEASHVRFVDGYGQLYVHGGTTTVSESMFTHQRYRVVDVVGGALSLTQSAFLDAATWGQGVSVQDGASAVMTENWWADPSGPKTTENPGGIGVPLSGPASFAPWLTTAPDLLIPTFTDPSAFVPEELGCTTQCYSNVLFLPGIMGSRLYWTDPSCLLVNCENKLWVPNRDDDVEKLYMATGTSLLDNIYAKEDDIVSSSTIGATYNSLFVDLNTLVASGTIV